MKKPAQLLRTLVIFAMCGCLLHAADILTQQDVIKLLELKIPEQTIIDKVKSSGTAFVLGTDDVARLKKAGASEALIAAMQSSSSVPAAGNPASEITDLMLIVDYSGSMNARMKDGAAKVTSAKKCVGELVGKLPNDLNVGLIVYGTNKKRGCEDIDVVQPLGPIDKAGIKAKIDGYNATGMTPIATSLDKAGEELRKAKGGGAIVLVTDGAESCHGDPAGVAAKLAAEFGMKFGINVIGFGIEPQEKKQLADIADKGHGKLLTVENATELADALKKVVAEKVAPAPKQRETKEYEAGGAAVKPGVFFGDAPVVKPGDYKGELAMMQACYYQVPVRKGQELRAIASIKKTPYQGSNNVVNQTFSITIYNSALQTVANEKSIAEGNPQDPISFRTTWTAEADGTAYVAVAASDNQSQSGAPISIYQPGHGTEYFEKMMPAPSSFTLKIKLDGEPGNATPAPRASVAAGTGYNNAGALTPPVLVADDLKLGETAFYKIAVKKGDVVHASAAFQKPWFNASNSAIKATYALTLYDDDQVQVAQKKVDVEMNPPQAQCAAIDWPATMNGNAYVSLSAQNSGQSIYPETYQPKPGRIAVQVITEGGSSPEGEKPAEGAPAETEKPAESPKPSPTKAPTDPFAGAESTPG